MIWACGWWVSADPQVWSTAVAPMRAEVLGTVGLQPTGLARGGDREPRFRRRAEQQVVDDRLVLVGDRRDLGGQCEDHVEIADRQQIGLACGKPILRRRTLALWAMAIAPRVVSDAAVAAILAAFDMPAQRPHGTSPWAEGPRSALLDRRHDLQLAEADMAGMGGTPSRPAVAEDVRHLDGWPWQQPRVSRASSAEHRAGSSP